MAAVLSCIMPVYNGEEYLEKSVQSVLDQSFAWFELILVNDGSTDRTADLCAEFARKDERVRVLTQPNKGAAAARNAGIQAAEGRYITFVDADDMLLPKNGYFEVPDRPGIGQELSEEAIAKSEIITVK